MKRLLLSILITLCLVFSFALPAFSASGSFVLVSQIPLVYSVGSQTRLAYTARWTGSSVDGSVPTLKIPAGGSYPLGGYFLLAVETAPGTTAPSASYTITITDDLGMDLAMAQTTSNRSASAPQSTMPNSWLPVMSDLVATVTQTNVSATGTVRFIFTSN